MALIFKEFPTGSGLSSIIFETNVLVIYLCFQIYFLISLKKAKMMNGTLLTRNSSRSAIILIESRVFPIWIWNLRTCCGMWQEKQEKYFSCLNYLIYVFVRILCGSNLKTLLAMIGKDIIYTDTVHSAIIFIETAAMFRTTQLIH